MGGYINWTALTVFIFFFALVAVLGFITSYWQCGNSDKGTHIEERGLGGRNLGTWITWFLVGGDFYTVYTVIAAPALVYVVGAYGFFALPYTILVHPIASLIMPKLWKVAHANGHITAADAVYGRYGSHSFEFMVALTGVVATMLYIALQLIGMEVVIKALGLTGELPLAAASVILALYACSAGLRASALIAFIKDIAIYIMVLVAVVLAPAKLGGYSAVFADAHDVFVIKGSATGLTFKPAQFLPFTTLAIGSALATFIYPHTLMGIFAARSANTIHKNAVFLPAYTVLLGPIVLLGFMAYVAGIRVTSNNDVVPVLFNALFPGWFMGLAFSAIVTGAPVPAAVMSVGVANLFTCNFWEPYVASDLPHAGEEEVTKVISLIVKAGALVFILFLLVKFALGLQLLGGVWVVQTFPSVVFGLFNISNRFRALALLADWAAGMIAGSWLAFSGGIKPVHTFVIDGGKYTIYTGLVALAFNITAMVVMQLLMGKHGEEAATLRQAG